MDVFLIYMIGAIVNFIATYYFWIKLAEVDRDISDSFAAVILFTILWPIMDILAIGFYVGGALVIGTEVLSNKIKQHKK